VNTPKNMKKILCIGDMCADIFSSPIERLPEPGQLGLTDEIAVYPGGNALNTAIALSRMGEQVAIAGSVGDDALGSLLLNQFPLEHALLGHQAEGDCHPRLDIVVAAGKVPRGR
jgi:sugar/nucleoside kinase (ribokinase family)